MKNIFFFAFLMTISFSNSIANKTEPCDFKPKTFLNDSNSEKLQFEQLMSDVQFLVNKAKTEDKHKKIDSSVKSNIFVGILKNVAHNMGVSLKFVGNNPKQSLLLAAISAGTIISGLKLIGCNQGEDFIRRFFYSVFNRFMGMTVKGSEVLFKGIVSSVKNNVENNPELRADVVNFIGQAASEVEKVKMDTKMTAVKSHPGYYFMQNGLPWIFVSLSPYLFEYYKVKIQNKK